ncbi:MAG: hypothetical protein WCP39_04640 [Chlamydiota bacterium]
MRKIIGGLLLGSMLLGSLLLFSAVYAEESDPMTKQPDAFLNTPILPLRDNYCSSVMVISPKSRAEDFLHAFDLLKKEKVGKVFFRFSDGSVVTNVQEMTLLTNGTMFLLKVTSNQGVAYRFVLIEDLLEIGHS